MKPEVILALGALLSLATGCASLENQRNDASRIDDLWAEALYRSSGHANTNGAHSPDELFSQAVDLAPAQKRGDILVSWGDLHGSFLGLMPVVRQFTDQSSEQLEARLEAEVGDDWPPTDQEQVDELARKHADRIPGLLEDSLREAGQDLVAEIARVQSRSHQLYLAALAASTNHLSAWGRVATVKTDDLRGMRELAIGRLQQLDPDNAHPWYLQALAKFEATDQMATLQALEVGNRKRGMSAWPAAGPQDFRWCPMEIKELMLSETDGRELTRVLLDSLRASLELDVRTKLQTGTRMLVTGKISEAKRLSAEGEHELARRWVRALALQSLKIVGNGDNDLTWALAGASNFRTVARASKELPAGTMTPEAGEWIARSERVVQRFLADFKELSAEMENEAPSPSAPDRTSILRVKERDDREREIVRKLRESSEFVELVNLD